MAAFSLGILLAPIIGPALGGWITDNYTWRWIFYLNVPVGLLSMFMVTNFVFDPDYLARVARKVDGWGIGLLALWIGALQLVLDTGQKHDWFGSNTIRVWAVLCVAGLIAFLVREFTCEDPVVDLRVFLDRTFAAGAFLITIIGFMLYASLVLLPIYLQTLLGYPAFDAGLAISPRGLGALIMMPVCGMLIGKVPSRLLIAIGLVIGGATMFQFARLNLQSGYWDIFWPQVFQGFGMAFLFIPITTMSVSHIAKPKMGNATSIFNLVRNIGGSFGIAIMTTFLSRRSQFHVNRLGENVSIYDFQTQQMFGGLRAFFIARGADAYTAGQRALAAMYGMVQQNAAMKAFIEAFWVMSVLFVSVVPLVFLMTEQHKRKAPAEKPPEPAPPVERPKVPEPAEERELLHV
jgi:DHA2 family multidrug resistance protein